MFGPDSKTVDAIVRALVELAAAATRLAQEASRRNDIAAHQSQQTEAIVREVMHRLDLPEAPDPGPTEADRGRQTVPIEEALEDSQASAGEPSAEGLEEPAPAELEEPPAPTWHVVRIDADGSTRVVAECGAKEHAQKARSALKAQLSEAERSSVQLVIQDAASSHPD